MKETFVLESVYVYVCVGVCSSEHSSILPAGSCSSRTSASQLHWLRDFLRDVCMCVCAYVNECQCKRMNHAQRHMPNKDISHNRK